MTIDQGRRADGRTYELWRRETGNRCGAFPTLAAALASVARTIDRHGEAAIGALALGDDDGDGGGGVIAEGAALIALARQEAS